MTIEANLPDGTVLRFPDGTDTQVIQNTVKSVIPQQSGVGLGTQGIQQASKRVRAERDVESLLRDDTRSDVPDEFREIAKEPGFLQAGAISTGRGLAKIGRALGLVEPETETEKLAFQALSEERPVTTSIGEAVGESLPFAAVPVGAIPGVAGRALGAAGLGAAEGLLIRRGEGATETEQLKGAGIGGGIGLAAETLLPVIGRIGSKLVRKATGRTARGPLLTASGTPTEELEAALSAAGVNFEDLKEAAIDIISQQPKGVVPEQAARAARFEELGIPATRGDITQEFGQQAIEQRLFESAADPIGDPLRSLRLQQSEGIKQNLDAAIDRAGVPENVGKSIKDALTGRKAFLKGQKNALYRNATKAAENVGAIPFPTDAISNAIPDERTLSRLSRLQSGPVNAAVDLLSEFGFLPPKEGIEQIQLTLENFDEFRLALNQIARADQTNTVSVITGPVINALDNEANDLVDVLSDAGAPQTLLGFFKVAQNTVKNLKTEFDPKGIVERLISRKGQAIDNTIEASKVYDNIVGTNRPIELLERTITSLKKAGPDGIKAIGDFQAATILDLLESGFKAETRRVQGVRTFGAVPFKRRMSQIGDDKLNLIFSTNPGLLKEIKKVASVADDLIPPSGAIPKGSASVILDSLNKAGIMTILGKLPGGGLLAEGITRLAEGQANRSALIKAMDARPELRSSIDLIQTSLPSVAVAFGLMAEQREDEQQ